MFGRRRRDRDEELEETAEGVDVEEAEVEDDDEVDDVGEVGTVEPADEEPPERRRRPEGPTTGPWDEADLPPDGESAQVGRVDLGALRVPVLDGLEIRVEVDPQGQVVAATVVDGTSLLQVGAFAAPRSFGLWDEIRAEILESLTGAGGTGEEGAGSHGPEVRAQLPGESPGQTLPARFIGVDGPRWFLRGLYSGPAAHDAAAATQLEAVFRDVVVVRGDEAMAPRDALVLRLPREAAEAAAGGEDDDETGDETADELKPFERGPEITEVR